MTCFIASYKNNNQGAAQYIGLMYEFGYGVDTNLEKAKVWYGKANTKN